MRALSRVDKCNDEEPPAKWRRILARPQERTRWSKSNSPGTDAALLRVHACRSIADDARSGAACGNRRDRAAGLQSQWMPSFIWGLLRDTCRCFTALDRLRR